MPTSSTRLGLVQATSTDNESLWPSQWLTNTTGLLDNAVLIGSGTLAARPATPSPNVAGQTYYATDTGQWFFWTGSAWNVIMVGGAWQNLTLTNCTATGSPWYSPQARVVGDRVVWRGAVTASSVSFSVTAPAGTRPASQVGVIYADNTSLVNQFSTVSTGGVLSPGGTSGHVYVLDSVSYQLS